MTTAQSPIQRFTRSVCPLVIVSAAFLFYGFDSNAQSPEDSEPIRVATFNVSLYGKKAGEIRNRLGRTGDQQAMRVAAIVQTVRPDVLLINELDFEPGGEVAKLLAKNYFSVPQNSADGNSKLQPMDYPYVYSPPTNTGVDSGLDINNDGQLSTPNDAWGYGVYPGQYAFSVFSRYPIDIGRIRTFQKLRWSEFPGALRPVDPKTNQPFHSENVWNRLRLSSKNHVDVPIQLHSTVLHVLASHPTPPVFDGPEDRNGRRNHDEIDFWNHYISDPNADYLVDDKGNAGGLKPNERFVVTGDLNCDPMDGSGRREAMLTLMKYTHAASPKSDGAKNDNLENQAAHSGDPANDTASFGNNGNMRVDFVLPSRRGLSLESSGVFWPPKSDPQHAWLRASDHRLVWVDVKMNPLCFLEKPRREATKRSDLRSGRELPRSTIAFRSAKRILSSPAPGDFAPDVATSHGSHIRAKDYDGHDAESAICTAREPRREATKRSDLRSGRELPRSTITFRDAERILSSPAPGDSTPDVATSHGSHIRAKDYDGHDAESAICTAREPRREATKRSDLRSGRELPRSTITFRDAERILSSPAPGDFAPDVATSHGSHIRAKDYDGHDAESAICTAREPRREATKRSDLRSGRELPRSTIAFRDAERILSTPAPGDSTPDVATSHGSHIRAKDYDGHDAESTICTAREPRREATKRSDLRSGRELPRSTITFRDAERILSSPAPGDSTPDVATSHGSHIRAKDYDGHEVDSTICTAREPRREATKRSDLRSGRELPRSTITFRDAERILSTPAPGDSTPDVATSHGSHIRAKDYDGHQADSAICTAREPRREATKRSDLRSGRELPRSTIAFRSAKRILSSPAPGDFAPDVATSHGSHIRAKGNEG